MPLYEYVCADCCRSFEILQRMGEGSDGVSCPKCSGTRIERQLSTFSGMSGSSSKTTSGASAGCGAGFS